jgi:hypothetical protein
VLVLHVFYNSRSVDDQKAAGSSSKDVGVGELLGASRRTNSHFRRIRPCSSSCFFLDRVIKISDDVLAGVGGVAKCHPLQLAVAWIYIIIPPRRDTELYTRRVCF